VGHFCRQFEKENLPVGGSLSSTRRRRRRKRS